MLSINIIEQRLVYNEMEIQELALSKLALIRHESLVIIDFWILVLSWFLWLRN